MQIHIGYLITLRGVLSILFLVATLVRAHAADTIEDFYKGKQITILCGTAGGGAYDTYVRAVARYMGKYVPGNPTFVVQ